jgi:hypothetical protein
MKDPNLFQLLFMALKYYPKVREKHRRPFSIFKIILTQPFYEFRFLNNFQLDLKKFRIDHPSKNKAIEKTGKAKMMESDRGNIALIPSNRSTCKATTTKENINKP